MIIIIITDATIIITCSTVVLSCYSATYDKPFAWSKAKFNLCNFVLPEPIITKLGRTN